MAQRRVREEGARSSSGRQNLGSYGGCLRLWSAGTALRSQVSVSPLRTLRGLMMAKADPETIAQLVDALDAAAAADHNAFTGPKTLSIISIRSIAISAVDRTSFDQ